MTEADKAAISRMRVSEIMTQNVKTATSSQSLSDVAAMMRDGDMGAVPVVDDGRFVGIVTDRDIVVRGIAIGSTTDSPIGAVMTTELFTVTPEDFVFEAVRLMGDKQVRRVPVVKADGSLAGIIAMADIALEMEDGQAIAETLEEISSGTAFWSKN